MPAMACIAQFFAAIGKIFKLSWPFIVIIKVLFLVDYEQNNAV